MYWFIELVSVGKNWIEYYSIDLGTWIERGRGTLRLNDKQVENATLQSRLVMRTQGCLRVILNTKVWTEMAVDKTSSKSIRLTAVDGEQIRVFLLMVIMSPFKMPLSRSD